MTNAHDPNDHVDQGPNVKITINGKSFTIHRGRQTVAELKVVGGVQLADDLAQIIAGQLHELADDGAVTLKGGEQFVSHPKAAASA